MTSERIAKRTRLDDTSLRLAQVHGGVHPRRAGRFCGRRRGERATAEVRAAAHGPLRDLGPRGHGPRRAAEPPGVRLEADHNFY